MSTAEKQYFSLLRAALWGTPVDANEAIDWDAVIRIAEHHSNNVLLSDLAFRLDEVNRPSPQLAAHMQSEMRGNLFKTMKLKQIMVSAVKLLREHHIEPVLLKGFGLAMLYPNPNLRQFGDIDLYVGLDRFHESCALLRQLPGGYNWGEEEDVGHQYNIEFGPYPMEIHRVSAETDDPKELSVYTAIERDGLHEHTQQVVYEGFEISIPSKEFMVFYTFYHTWHHFLTSGVGWRQVADTALTLHAYHGALNLEKLHSWLVQMHLLKPWQAFGYLMVEQLGLPQSELPFYDARCRSTARRLYRRIMMTGNFRRQSHFKQSKPREGGIRHKMHSFGGIFVDFVYQAKVFPDAAFRELRKALSSGLRKNIQKN